MMKRFLIATTLGLTMALGVYAQGMSDQQVLAFIGSEVKAGTSQAQIVTKLMQKMQLSSMQDLIRSTTAIRTR